MRKPLALAVVLPLALAPVVATPAQAQGIVKQKKLQANIKQGFKSRGYTATVKCPKNVTWVKGKVFYCKVTYDGTKGRVQVKLTSGVGPGKLVWKLV